MFDYSTRPLSDRTWLRPVGRIDRSRFTASWSSTLEILERELGFLRATKIVMGIDIEERELRLDGGVRANARPQSDGVELAFESRHGPLLYRCDIFTVTSYRSRTQPWQDNVRCIALTLESLRAVDRYGATKSGEQYRGFRALPAGGNGSSHMDREQALALVTEISGIKIVSNQSRIAACRRAKAKTHPDINAGDRTRWDLVEQALDVIGRDY